MLNGETRRVSIDTVHLVADIVGDDRAVALRAAAGVLIGEAEERDPRLKGLDPADPVVQKILALDIDDELREMMLDRRREILARRHEDDLKDIEFWANQNRGRGVA